MQTHSIANSGTKPLIPPEKLLVLEGTATDGIESGLASFVVLLDKDDIARIKHLAKVVVKLEVFAVREFFYSGAWFSQDVEDLWQIMNEGQGHHDPMNIACEIKRVDIPEIHVTRDSFYFTAVPKHGSDLGLTKTSRVNVADLDSLLPYLDFDE